MRMLSFFFVMLVIAASCAGDPRPMPQEPNEAWDKYCATKPNCGLCASEGKCGYCPDTNQCLRYSKEDVSAKVKCPSLVTIQETCL